MSKRIWNFQSAILLIVICLGMTGCAGVEPPTEDEKRTARAGEKVIILFRVTGEDDRGQPLKAFTSALVDNNVGFSLGHFGSGGEPDKRIEHYRFLSDRSRKEGWIFLTLDPGLYYLYVQPPRPTDIFTYMAMFKSAPRWRMDVPSGSSLIYAGTLYLRGITQTGLFGGKIITGIDGERSKVLNEETVASKLTAQHLGDLGSPRTSLMRPHRGPLILRTPTAR